MQRSFSYVEGEGGKVSNEGHALRRLEGYSRISKTKHGTGSGRSGSTDSTKPIGRGVEFQVPIGRTMGTGWGSDVKLRSSVFDSCTLEGLHVIHFVSRVLLGYTISQILDLTLSTTIFTSRLRWA